MEEITTRDIYDCFGIESPILFNVKLETKNDLLTVIRFCISVSQMFIEDRILLDEEDDI